MFAFESDESFDEGWLQALLKSTILVSNFSTHKIPKEGTEENNPQPMPRH